MFAFGGRATYSSSTNDNDPESSVSRMIIVPGKGLPPEIPTTCCMTGCSNCVWIKYVEDLTEYYNDKGEMAKKAIENVQDESIKIFLKMQLQVKD